MQEDHHSARERTAITNGSSQRTTRWMIMFPAVRVAKLTIGGAAGVPAKENAGKLNAQVCDVVVKKMQKTGVVAVEHEAIEETMRPAPSGRSPAPQVSHCAYAAGTKRQLNSTLMEDLWRRDLLVQRVTADGPAGSALAQDCCQSEVTSEDKIRASAAEERLRFVAATAPAPSAPEPAPRARWDGLGPTGTELPSVRGHFGPKFKTPTGKWRTRSWPTHHRIRACPQPTAHRRRRLDACRDAARRAHACPTGDVQGRAGRSRQ